jgi:gas vesicle protein
MTDWVWSLNVLELTGLMVWLTGGAVAALVAWCVVGEVLHARKVKRERQKAEEMEAAAIAEWLAVEEERWSKRAAPLIERLINESKTRATNDLV